MTIADTAPRTMPFGLRWLGRFTPRVRIRRDDRFTPVAELPPYLLYDIGVSPDRLDQVKRHHW